MNLNSLKAFVHSAQLKSFTRAAEQLEITQPAVSKAVRELEQQMQVVLFERRGKTIELTEVGRMLLEYGASLLNLHREAEEVVKRFKTLDRGTLVIGASTTVGAYWLGPVISKYQRKYPGVGLTLITGNTEEISKRLLDCALDVAVVEGLVDNEQIESRVWREEDLILLGPTLDEPGNERVDLGQQTWLLREQGSGTRRAAEKVIQQLGVNHVDIIEMGSNEAILQAIASGCGVGVVPKIVARDALALKRVRRIQPAGLAMKRTLFRLRLPHRPVSNAALAFEAILGQPKKLNH